MLSFGWSGVLCSVSQLEYFLQGMSQIQMPDNSLFCVCHFRFSSFSNRYEWKTTHPLPTLENYWTDFCKRKLVENKALWLFND